MQFIQTNVNTVHAALMDSLWGFKECATVVPDLRLKDKFETIAFERERMVRELEIRGGATKSSSGSVKGSLTRTWTKIKSSLSSGGIQHVLDDLAQEEANLRKIYNDAINSQGVDSSLNGLLFTHLRNIECHLSELRIICGEAKYGNKWDTTVPSTGEILKGKLQTTGQTISGKLQTTGQTISSKLSSTGATISSKFSTSGAVIKDKLGFGQTHTDNTTVDTTVNNPEHQQTMGQQIKEKLQTTGTIIKDKAQATGTVIKDKLGFGQTTQDTAINSNVTTNVDLPQL
jgi:uncharacterized protein (TIGR02284 family)